MMVRCILDASVVIEYLVTGEYTPHAQALFAQSIAEIQFVVPEFCLLECTNVLWKQVRFNGMPPGEGQKLMRHLRKLPLARVPVKAVLSSALMIGLKHQLAAYDSAYVALVLRLGYPLVSIDQPQIRAALAESAPFIPITNFA